MAEIDNNENIIDSRKVIERIAELEERQEAAGTCARCDEPITEDDNGDGDPVWVHDENGVPGCAGTGDAPTAEPSDEPLDDDEAEELRALKALAEQGETATHGWLHGATLIHDDHFKDYAREMIEETDGVDTSVWPFNCIDWERAASDLQVDYTSIDFDGETYWTHG